MKVVEVEGEELLLYKSFPINVVFIRASYADEFGNCTVHREIGPIDVTAMAQACKNSRALGQALYERGVPVLCPDLGFTRSHAIAVDVSQFGGGKECAKLLEDANIICNKNMLPRDTSSVNPSGLRLGSQEITRLGMKESEMDEVADFIARVVVKKEDPSKVKEDVKAFKKQFATIQYCFNAGEPAYGYHKLVE